MGNLVVKIFHNPTKLQNLFTWKIRTTKNSVQKTFSLPGSKPQSKRHGPACVHQAEKTDGLSLVGRCHIGSKPSTLSMVSVQWWCLSSWPIYSGCLLVLLAGEKFTHSCRPYTLVIESAFICLYIFCTRNLFYQYTNSVTTNVAAPT